MEPFRIATFNTHHGKVRAFRYSPKRLYRSIESLDADIICLQELDVWALRTFFSHQPRQIAKHLGYELATSRVRFFGVGYQYNAILSRFPILSSHESILPGESSAQVRKYLAAEIEVGTKAISVVSTHLHAHAHLSQPNEEAQRQLEFVFQNVNDGESSIVAGDFNLVPEVVFPIAQKFGYGAPHEFPTSPAMSPRHQIDYLCPKNVALHNVHASDHLISDHRALVADVVALSS
jgi:endonuclease/exonuclease/phosphatase family metal-dependent hydrolase